MTHDSNICNSAVQSIEAQSKALKTLASRIDSVFENVVELILECNGKIVISGMGKSGIIGKKIAATFASTGTQSIFIHPSEALHGDLGMVLKDDLILLISNSGETEEILRLLPALHQFGNKIVAMVGSVKSNLARSSNYILDISVESEVCPNNLAPTTSTIVTMAMGDALAVALMIERNFQPRDFALFHPGGNLGRKLLMHVQDVMHKNIPTAYCDTSLQDVMLIMSKGRLGLSIILNFNNQLIGIFTDGDLRRAMSDKRANLDDEIEKYMTLHPKTIKENLLLAEAEDIMLANKIHCLIVVDDTETKPIGIIEIFD